MIIPEILAPAGNMEKLRTAVLYGADAVYLGGRAHNLRAAAHGFDGPDLERAVSYAHERGVRIYYCINSLFREEELSGLPSAIEEAASAGVDAFIVADAGAFQLKNTYAPHIPAHMSTQLNTCNSQAVRFWQDLGATRINLARELSCREIHAIGKAVPDMELEVFTHGAMCLAVSGQCLLSAWLNDRPANSGRCTQPCRFQYRPHGSVMDNTHAEAGQKDTVIPSIVVEESLRPGEALWRVQPSGPDGQSGFSSMWAMEDLCLMPYLRWLKEHGIAALKIEGRMKGAAYVAHAVDAYKSAVTCLAEGRPFDYHTYMPELLHTASRSLGSGFFLPHKRRNYTEEMGTVPGAWQKEIQTSQHLLAALVQGPASADSSAFMLAMRGQWKEGYSLECMLPGLRRPVLAPYSFSLESADGTRLSVANSGQQAVLRLGDEAMQLIASSGGQLEAGVFIRTTKADDGSY